MAVLPVISCAFLSGIGLSGLAQFAAAYAPENVAMGLDTYKWLKEDLLEKPFRADEGKVDIEKIVQQSAHIDKNLLIPL